jgi:hypothetical protein
VPLYDIKFSCFLQNEEAIQLKEQYRGVVRKELEDMERRHWDMTSILRALGIPVEGGEVCPVLWIQ